MNRFFIFLMFFFTAFNIQAQYYEAESQIYSEERSDETGAPAQHVASGTLYYPQKSYFVPYHVRQNQYRTPKIAPPPVLWGDDLYYPYQLQEHARFDTQGDLNHFIQHCAPETLCASRPAVVCRQAGCTRLNDRMTKQYLFNTLTSMFLSNSMSQVDICEADPHSRACLSNAIRFGGRIGGTPVLIQIPTATLVEMKPVQRFDHLSVFLNYDVFANGRKAKCSGALSTVDAISTQQLILRDSGYQCELTAGAPTTAFSMYNIDYIDLDHGIIGGFYSIGLSGESAAGGTGYMLMKFRNSPFVHTDTKKMISAGNYGVSPYSKSKENDDEFCEDECDEIVEEVIEE